jgi:cobalt-zinc-cadmium resistance protein CzcA
MSKNQSDILAYTSELKRLLNSQVSIEIAKEEFTQADWNNTGLDSAISGNPLLALQRQQIEIADKAIGVERARSGPDFTIGYFNQSIIGNQNVNGQDKYFNGGKRFQGVQAGISVPLFFKPFSSRIRAATIEKQVAESQFSLFQTNLQGQYNRAYQDLLKNARSIEYYKSSALPNANLILKQSQIAFQNGEIGYVEYLQGLRTYSDIRFNYLQAINEYNQSVFTLQYLMGL